MWVPSPSDSSSGLLSWELGPVLSPSFSLPLASLFYLSYAPLFTNLLPVPDHHIQTITIHANLSFCFDLSSWKQTLKSSSFSWSPSHCGQVTGHLCTSFFVCCKNGLYKEVLPAKVLYLAVSVQTSLNSTVVNEWSCCNAFGRASALGVFSSGIVWPRLPSYQWTLSCCYWGFAIAGVQLCITNMLSAAICTAQGKLRPEEPGTCQEWSAVPIPALLSPLLGSLF